MSQNHISLELQWLVGVYTPTNDDRAGNAVGLPLYLYRQAALVQQCKTKLEGLHH